MGRRVKKDALYAAFEEKGFNAKRAAKVCDMSQSYFSNCETSGIPDEIAEKLKSRLEIDVDMLPEYIGEEPAQAEMMQTAITKEDITEAVAQGVRKALEAYFGEKRVPIQTLADKWKDALHGLESEQ